MDFIGLIKPASRLSQQTYTWVVPLGTSHPKFLRPIQLQDNTRLTLKNKFSPNYLSKGYPSHVESKNLIKFIKKMCFDVEMNAHEKKFKNVA